MEAVDKTVAPVRKPLSEYDSKQLIAKYGIPVTREQLARSAEDAVAAADAIGYPVALKACGAELTHKTELNVIRLGLKDAAAVRAAAAELFAATKTMKADGLLVQEMVSGQRELVMGLIRDPQFGPCVMFGLGGIYTEILRDVSFRVAPLTPRDALEMMDEIRGKKILEAFRGMAAADKSTLGAALVALGALGLEHADVAEIDINPLILTKDGRPIAVDALVVKS